MSAPNPYTPELLAERWHCSAEKVRQMYRKGELRGFRLGRMIRINPDSVEEVEGCQRKPGNSCDEVFG